MGSDSICQKLSDESINQRTSLYRHAFHSADSKDPYIYILDR